MPVSRLDGSPLTDYDVLLKNAVIQVRSNNGKGLASQIARTMTSTELPVIGYSPRLGPFAARSIEQVGGLATNSLDELVAVVAP